MKGKKLLIRRRLRKLLRSNKALNVIEKRKNKDKLFSAFVGGGFAIILLMFIWILVYVFSNGYRALYYYEILIPHEGDVYEYFDDIGVTVRYNDIYNLLSLDYTRLRENGEVTNGKVWVRASTKFNMFMKSGSYYDEYGGNGTILQHKEVIRRVLNKNLFSRGDSNIAEKAGILGSIIGSLRVLGIAILCSAPIGIILGMYLEESSKKTGILYSFLNTGINNLLAVPSIIYGMVGALIFIKFLHIPRASALVGGLTLSLMMIPIIVMTTRQRCAEVNRDIVHAALALGATKEQVIIYTISRMAAPGIISGVILSIARVIGETAPLLMLGMVAFIVDIPENFVEQTTVLPVQIYMWVNSIDSGFEDLTSFALGVLLIILLGIILISRMITKWVNKG